MDDSPSLTISRGYLGPGGLADNSSHPSCTGGAAGYIDHQVFGENHIYGHPTCKVSGYDLDASAQSNIVSKQSFNVC